MKQKITIKAPAKVNIALDVRGVKDNGYHEMRMVNHTIALHDVLTFSEIQEGIALSCNMPGIPTDERNLVWKAANHLKEAFGIRQGVSITIDKQIPSEAGLAGGSADAAAALIGLSRLWQLDIALEQLYQIGAAIGADIPYCCFKGTALVEGIGEIITPLKPLNRMAMVVAKPSVNIATPWAFKQLDEAAHISHPDIDAVIRAIELEDFDALRQASSNVFEPVVFAVYPEIAALKKQLYELGACFAIMSGSGSTVVGYFETGTVAQKAAKELKRHFQNTFLTEIE